MGLQLATLDLGVTEELLVDKYILLEIVDNLYHFENKTIYLDLFIKGKDGGL